MNIQKVRLKGFLGLKKGLGLEEISLDLSDARGLIAFSGPTGIGKTTIMENLHPYPQLVSRPGKAIKNHVYLRDSIKELSWIHNGIMYESTVKIDAESERTEGFLKVDNHPVVDGKITEYKNFISDLFGSPNLFFNSVFCAQNSVKISGLQPADLKALFAEFLGDRLQKLIGYEDTSKQASGFYSVKLGNVDHDIEALENKIAEKLSIEISLDYQQAILENTERKLNDFKTCLAGNKESLKADRVAKIASDKNEVKVDFLVAESKRAGQELDGLNKQSKREIEDLLERYREIKTEIHDVEILIARKGEIETASATKASTTKIIESIDKTIDGCRQKQTEVYNENSVKTVSKYELEGQLSEIAKKVHYLKNDVELSRLDSKIKVAEERAADLERVGTDLHDPSDQIIGSFKCNSENCEFITKAVEAKKDLPGLHKERHDYVSKTQASILVHEKERDEINTKLAGLQQDIKRLADEQLAIQKSIEDLDLQKAKYIKQLNGANDLAAKLPKIEAAESKKAELEKALADTKARGEETRKVWNEQIDLKTKHMDEISAQIDKLKPLIDSSIPDRIKGHEERIRETESEIKSMETAMVDQKAEIIRIQKDLEQYALDEKELEGLRSDRIRIISELTDWNYLKDACGANGLRPLEIEAVAPGITYDANRLLEAAFGAWAMVDFRTQNEDGREVLEPRVIDQDGESVLIANRSGGQQVWALKALRLAMTMVSKQKSGCDFKSAYADEDDAGLDVETAQSFTKLYKAFIDIGDFEKCFYISHKKECVALADHILEFGSGGIRLI